MKQLTKVLLIVLLFQVVSPLSVWAAAKFNVIYLADGTISGQVYSDEPIKVYVNESNDISSQVYFFQKENVIEGPFSSYPYYTEFVGKIGSGIEVERVTIYDGVYASTDYKISDGLDLGGEMIDFAMFDTLEPTAPQHIKADLVTDQEINFSWELATDNIAVNSYEIFVDDELYAVVDASKLKNIGYYALTGLETYSTHKIQVRAVDTHNNYSPFSDEVEITTLDSIAPTTPTDVEILEVSDQQALLSWTSAEDNAGIQSYEIYLDGLFFAEVEATEKDSNLYEMNELTPYTSYSVSIVAVDYSDNVSDLSDAVEFKTLDLDAPTMPSNMKIDNIYYNSLKISWKCSRDNIGVKYYNIYNRANIIKKISAKSCAAELLKLKKGTTLKLSISAIDPSGNVSKRSPLMTYQFKPSLSFKSGKVFINGKAISFGKSLKPKKLSNKETIASCKPILQAFGLTVNYDVKKKYWRMYKAGDLSITLHANKAKAKIAIVNGKAVKLNSPTQIISGNPFVSLQFIAKTLGVPLIVAK